MGVDIKKFKEEGFHPVTSGWGTVNEKEYWEVHNAIDSCVSLTDEQKSVLKKLNYEHHVGHYWSVGYGDTEYVMNALGLSRKRADGLIMTVLSKLDRKYGY